MKRIYIEITNICNLSCAFCKSHDREPRIMTVNEFEHILKQVKPYTDFIYLHVQGEPLIHPYLEEILHLTDQYQMQVQLVTNAVKLFNHTNLYNHLSLRKISFSLQSIEYQPVTDPIQYLNTILDFCKTSSSLGHPYCEIRFWRDDQASMPRTLQCIQYLKENYYFMDTNRRKSCEILKNVYISYGNEFEWPNINEQHETIYGTCHGAIDQLAILSNGTVVPCCLDADGNIPLGNIFQNNLNSILHSSRYIEMVEGFRKHILIENLCKKCTFRKRFK